MYPGDKIAVIGTDKQLGKIKDLFEKPGGDTWEPDKRQEEIVLQNLTITKDSRFYKKSIRKSGIREQAKALVVGLERNGERILNPDSFVILQENDIIWVVCVKEKLEEFLRGEVVGKTRNY
jgi:CPA2 family monovalent cation:H+ antiporter-2